MTVLRALTKTFLLEFLREKILVVGLLLAVALSLLGLVLGSLSFDEKTRIAFHLSISALHLISLALAIFFGSSTLHREVERQTCLLVLSRPVTRTQFYISKFLAIGLLVFIFQVLLSVVVGLLTGSSFNFVNYLMIFCGVLIEILVVLSYSLYASVWLRPTVAAFASVGVFLIGHWMPDLDFFAKKSESAAFKMIADFVHWVLPHLYRLNFRSFYFLQTPPSWLEWSLGLAHGGAWIITFLILGSLMWKRKDLV